MEIRARVVTQKRMIARIEALGYRSLRYVRLEVAPFQMLVGPNGSGKSNLLDVPAFLGDLLRVGPRDAILGNLAHGVPPRTSDPSFLGWMRTTPRVELAVELAIPPELLQTVSTGRFRRARYEVAVSLHQDRTGVALAAETLWLIPGREHGLDQRQVFPSPPDPPGSIVRGPFERTPRGWRKVVSKIAHSGNDYFRSEITDWNSQFRLGPTRSALANLPEDEERFPVATWVKRVLMEGIERVVLNAESLRAPSPPGSPERFRPDGSNLSWVIQGLKDGAPDRLDRWVDHVRTAIPDLKTIHTVERPEDRHRYLVVEYVNGLRGPSWIVSDGTLRLLALTLIAYLADEGRIYLIEEPENGIHPRAVETVYQSLSGVHGSQLLCASHSPVVLSLARREDLLCFARDDAGATDIVPGHQHPWLREWKGSLDLGTLFAAGVLG
jgi:hypothetical protein